MTKKDKDMQDSYKTIKKLYVSILEDDSVAVNVKLDVADKLIDLEERINGEVPI